MFASEEYKSFSDSKFNEVFGLFLNGNNIGTIPGTSTSISLINVNQNVNSEFYVGNEESYYNIEINDFTTTLQAKESVGVDF